MFPGFGFRYLGLYSNKGFQHESSVLQVYLLHFSSLGLRASWIMPLFGFRALGFQCWGFGFGGLGVCTAS